MPFSTFDANSSCNRASISRSRAVSRIRWMTPLLSAVVLATMGGAAGSQEPVNGTQSLVRSSKSQLSPADQLQIIDVIARMNQAIDSEDYAAYAEFYTADGVIDSGFGPPTEGRQAIIESLEASAPFITNKRHVAANIVINGNEQSATVDYYLTVFERTASLTLAGTAVITDEFMKVDDEWLVMSHTTRMDAATLAAMSAAMQSNVQPQ